MDQEITNKILAYAQERGTFTIPELQMTFRLGYREAWEAVNELVRKKSVQFEKGIVYKCLLAQEKREEKRSFFRSRREEVADDDSDFLDALFGVSEDDEDDEDEDDVFAALTEADKLLKKSDEGDADKDETPAASREPIPLTAVTSSQAFLKAGEGSTVFAIGKEPNGSVVCGDFSKMKHILVGGATGTGKVAFIHAMIASLIGRYSPDELRLILMDAKQVNLAHFEGIPHLLTGELLTTPQQAVNALSWAIKEMEHRYALFLKKTGSGQRVWDINEYNLKCGAGEQKLPKIVIVIDELADFIVAARQDMEQRIVRLVQKSRAAGIYLVLATQRPTVNVVLNTIKANIPTRIAFRTVQPQDSQVILDERGAEKLAYNGDMLIKTEGKLQCTRAKGVYIPETELKSIVKLVKGKYRAAFDGEANRVINLTACESKKTADEEVPMEYIKALATVIREGSASISLVQRRCSVGYAHAGRIIEWMEEMGYISPFDGTARARTVYMTQEEFNAKYGWIV